MVAVRSKKPCICIHMGSLGATCRAIDLMLPFSSCVHASFLVVSMFVVVSLLICCMRVLSRVIESQSDVELLEPIWRALRDMFGEANVPQPTILSVTRWNTDPFQRGAYSYIKKGKRKQREQAAGNGRGHVQMQSASSDFKFLAPFFKSSVYACIHLYIRPFVLWCVCVMSGSSIADVAEYAAPVSNCLFFAGEGTCESDAQTVHGAYISGVRAADQIM